MWWEERTLHIGVCIKRCLSKAHCAMWNMQGAGWESCSIVHVHVQVQVFALWCVFAKLGPNAKNADLFIIRPCSSWLSFYHCLLALGCSGVACCRNIDQPWLLKSHSRLSISEQLLKRCSIHRYPFHPEIPNPSSVSHNNQTTPTTIIWCRTQIFLLQNTKDMLILAKTDISFKKGPRPLDPSARGVQIRPCCV